MFATLSKCFRRLVAAGTTGPGVRVCEYFVPFTPRQRSTDGPPIRYFCATDEARRMDASGCDILFSPSLPGNIFFCLETTSFYNDPGRVVRGRLMGFCPIHTVNIATNCCNIVRKIVGPLLVLWHWNPTHGCNENSVYGCKIFLFLSNRVNY
jgi:hypothetical protein